MDKQFTIEFHPSGRGKAQCSPDPAYPDGKRIDSTTDWTPKCTIEFPYPAPECGHYRATCNICNRAYAVTAAGRVDDPRSLTIPCPYKTAQN